MKRANRDRQTGTGAAPVRTRSESLRYVLAVQLEGVMGEVQQRHDVVLVGNYERDREICERAIEQALAALNAVEASGDEKSDEFHLAWAWQGLNEAYMRLGRVVSRAHLARRRAEVAALRAEKARAKPKEET